MNVRKKAILTVTVIFTLTLMVVLLTSPTVILPSFQELERKDMETQLARATDALNSDVKSLDTFVHDYATWDDTYIFIKDNNAVYIKSNLSNETFSHSSLNLMIYINSSGQMVFFKTYNLNTTTEKSVFESMVNLFSKDDSLWNFEETENHTSGLLSIGESIFLIASRPILTSEGEGPVGGAVLMGRELSSDRINTLSEETHLQIEIISITNYLPSDFQEAKTNLPRTGSAYIEPLNSSFIAGYTMLGDTNDNPVAILHVHVARNIFQEGVNTINTFTILIILLFIVFGAATVLFLEKVLLSRVTNLTTKVTKLANSGDINQRVRLEKERFGSKDDELSLLSSSINAMLDKIQQITGALNKSQRFAAVGELSVMIAHDLRNPLQGISIAADFLTIEKTSSPEKKTRMLDLIKKDVVYCEKIVNDLLGYSREIKIMPSKTDVKSLLTMSLSNIKIPENVHINNSTQTEPKIDVDSEKMQRVFDNLVKNAIDAMPDGGSLTAKSQVSGDKMRISFTDTGKGITKEDMDKLFVPLFTTKAKGMGFGLAICKRIIEAHQGKISAESIVGKGTTFTIEVPLKR